MSLATIYNILKFYKMEEISEKLAYDDRGKSKNI